MKKSALKAILYMVFFLLGFVSQVLSQPLLVEDFSYTAGQAITANGWTAHSSGGTNPITVSASLISYAGYLSSGVGNEIAFATSGEDDNKSFTAQTSGSVYVSFLVNVTSATTTGDYFFHLGGATMGTTFHGRVFIKKDASTGNLAFGITKTGNVGSAVWTPYSYLTGQTNLVVLKYNILAGTTNDYAQIFINPPLNSAEPVSGWFSSTDNTTTDLASIATVGLRQGTASSAPVLKLDGIRISKSWVDIVGPTGSPVITVSALSPFGNVPINTVAGPNSFTITGTDLTTADVNVAALNGFTYCTTPAGTYTSSLSLSHPAGAYSQTIYVRFSPTAVQSYDGNIVVSGGGASSANVAAAGAGILPAPIATAATNIGHNSFAANWNSVSGATGYYLDVYKINPPTVFTSDLFISEYGEGSSNNKYIEIFNGTGVPVDLSTYTLKQALNGTGWDVDLSYTLPLSGILADQDVYVIAASTANATILAQADLQIVYNAAVQGGRITYYTGNDAIGLFKEGVLIDIFGEPNNSAIITVAGDATAGLDHTMIRKSTVTTPNDNWATSGGSNATDSEWIVNPVDTWTNLGTHSFTGGQTFSNVISNLDVGNVTSHAVTTLTPGSDYFYLLRAYSGASTSSNSNTIFVSTLICPTWTGAFNPDYHDCRNWAGGLSMPDITDDVLIPSGCELYPILDAGEILHCHNMELGSELKSGKAAPVMGISGEFIVDGNLTIKAGATVLVYDGGWVTINGNLYNYGSLILESGSSLITNGTVSGTATVKRDIPNDLSWHLLSSPVNSQLICNDVFAPSISSFPGNINSWDFYKWSSDCPPPPDNHWINLRTPSGTLNTTDFGTTPSFTVTKGYLVAYGTDFAVSKSFVGTPNTGDKTFSFADILTNCSWELAGNPYPSAIDWSLVTDKENLISDYYYVWNENKSGGPGYEFWKDDTHFSSTMIDGYIPSMQGFFVQVDPNGGKELGLPNSARVHDVDMWLKSENPSDNRLSIQLSNGENYDETFVMFENGSNMGRDRNDAEKLFSMNTGIPQVYSIIDNDMKACMNAMSYISGGVTIPLGIKVPVDGNYSITTDGIANFSNLTGLTLEDLKLNYTQNLIQNPVYNFSASGTEDAGRFLLHFAGTIGMNEKNNDAITIYSNEKTVFISCKEGFRNATVTISNLLGQEILTQELKEKNINQVKVNGILQGYYIVKVQDESSVKTAKVYLN